MGKPKTIEKNTDPYHRTPLIDLNVLPSRYRRKKIKPLHLLPWVLWVALLGLMYPVVANLVQAQMSFQQAKSKFQSVQASIEAYQPLAQEMESLQAEIETAHQTTEAIQRSYRDIKLDSPLWSEVLTFVTGNTPQGIKITNLVQNGDQILVEGNTDSYQRILEMDQTLKGVERFSNVELQSINQVNDEESAPNPPSVYQFQFSIEVNERAGQP
jgi:Tfp pilus assembly protein PilN